ncbi:hypothetical protein, partial [Ruegeria faecimaris]|uniref:hypothetical protein n=1 Tax=Ruegeria faecimaris TaxID=686389 RepID=UPI00248F61FE
MAAIPYPCILRAVEKESQDDDLDALPQNGQPSGSIYHLSDVSTYRIDLGFEQRRISGSSKPL